MEGKLAVATGAANGIGLEFARQCVQNFGMSVVIADVDAAALGAAATMLRGLGGDVTAVVTDVRRRADVERLLVEAQRASADGNVDVAFFNAGVLGSGVTVMKGDEAAWRWVLDVNLFGVLHGLQVFTPVCSKQHRPCLIAATASTQGLDIGGPPGSTASYATSKADLLPQSCASAPTFVREPRRFALWGLLG